MVSPLTTAELLPSRWGQFVPIPGLSHDLLRWRASRELQQRVPEEVERSWMPWPHLRTLRTDVGGIIADSCRWPNTRFVPDDECAVLFPGDLEMSGAIALTRIAELEHLDSILITEMLSSHYLDLLVLLYEMRIGHATGSGNHLP